MKALVYHGKQNVKIDNVPDPIIVDNKEAIIRITSITHILPLEDAPRGYDLFHEKKEQCIKVVLKPW